MNNELRKNAEGYTDPTAAATLTRKESADIWEYNGGECLIIKGHPGFATILRLHDTDKYGNLVKVADRDDGPRYVDPAFIISGKYKDMGRYVETLDAVTFEKVITAMETALQINLHPQTSEPANDKTAALMEKLTAAREHLGTVEGLLSLKKSELTAANNATTKYRNQLELLREMYNDLLGQVLSKEG